MFRKSTFIVALLALCAGSALAQSVEITPTLGYVFGGDFDDAFSGDVAGKLSLDDSEEYGISADFLTREGWGVELLWMRQDTDIDGADSFIHDSHGASLTTFHIGGIYQFRRGTTMQPFVVGTLGASQFKSGGSAHSGFSYGAGGGVKFYFADHFGARLQGTISNAHFTDDDRIACSSDACFGLSNTNGVLQFSGQAGFIFRF